MYIGSIPLHNVVVNSPSSLLLQERGRRKCDMYWPKDVGPEARVTYGFFEVQLEREEVLANYTVRTMKLKHLKVTRLTILHCNLLNMAIVVNRILFLFGFGQIYLAEKDSDFGVSAIFSFGD